MMRYSQIICALAQSSTPNHHAIIMKFFEGDSLNYILSDKNCKSKYNLSRKSKIKIS